MRSGAGGRAEAEMAEAGGARGSANEGSREQAEPEMAEAGGARGSANEGSREQAGGQDGRRPSANVREVRP